MTTEPDSRQPSPPPDNRETNNGSVAPTLSNQADPNLITVSRDRMVVKNSQTKPPLSMTILVAISTIGLGLYLNNFWIVISGAIVSLLVSSRVLWLPFQSLVREFLPAPQRSQLVAIVGIVSASAVLAKFSGLYKVITNWGKQINWEASGSLAEWFGALGQIFIAFLAVYVAWQQYIISRDLTIKQNELTAQQNLITQQQTIDTYFQGISDLVLDDEGLLEDWPQERLLAEGRTAAILGSVDPSGKAKILRFLSSSKLLTPLQRDSRLGRAIFDGTGGYAEDRVYGVRVIDLAVMLAKADLSGTDLRRTDLSDANLIGANLNGCDLVKANLARTILYEAKLAGSDLKGALLFYGSVQTANPRAHTQPPYPNYQTGAYTGAVVEKADFTDVIGLSEDQRQYCCEWGGEETRKTIPGGCEGIPNKLGR